MIEFQVSTRHTDQKRVIKVMVYDTVDDLRQAARKRDGYFGLERGNYEEAAGLVQYIDASHDGGKTFKLYLTMRLAVESLMGRATEIIAHESTHAALFLLRHDGKDPQPLENQVDGETLCYLVGDITRKVVNKLYERKVLS